jgi:hypothetical protein
VVGSWIAAHVVAWRYPRAIQRLHKTLILPLELRLSASKRFDPAERHTRSDISPYFWPNGKMPDSDEWNRLAEGNFREYRLRASGCVENQVDLSLEQIRALGHDEHIALHHCIQGWSGIAQWGGISMVRLIGLVQPLTTAHAVEFISFGDGIFGGVYYDTRLEDVVKPECLLAYEMNDVALPKIHGAPLRLRVSSASRWSNGSVKSALLKPPARSAKAMAERTKMMSISICCHIFKGKNLVAGIFFHAHVVAVHSGSSEDRLQPFYHRRRTGNVKDAALRRVGVFCQHLGVDRPCFAYPEVLGVFHIRHRYNHRMVGVCFL